MPRDHIETTAGMIIPCLTMAAAFAAPDTTMAAAFAAPDTSRGVLNGVHITAEPRADQREPARLDARATKYLRFRAADGFRLIDIDSWIPAPLDWTPTTWRLDDVKSAIKALRQPERKAQKRMTIYADRIEATPDMWSDQRIVYYLQTWDGTYPNTDQIMPPEHQDGGNVAFNGRFLEEIGALARRFSGSGIVRWMSPTQPSSPVRADWKAEELYSVRAVFMPMSVQW